MSSKSLLDLLPAPKSGQNLFKPKPSTTTTTENESKSTSNLLTQPKTKSNVITKNTDKISSSAVISSKPVPKTSALSASASISSKESSSSIAANYSKIKKTNENFFGIESYGNDTDDEEETEETNYQTYSNDYYNEATNINNNLQDPAIEDVLKYENRKKRRHDATEINIVDVNLSDVIQKNKEDLLKNLTTEPIRPSRQYVGTGRKHHQITYLAMLAKERDQELKSQWADNKFNRKQSRMKYGF